MPESIGDLRKLQKLTLHDNKLKNIPESIGNLCELRELQIDNNKELTLLPETMRCCTNLRKLRFNIHDLKYMSDIFYDMRNLDIVYMYRFLECTNTKQLHKLSKRRWQIKRYFVIALGCTLPVVESVLVSMQYYKN
jgi:hypothetical protein